MSILLDAEKPWALISPIIKEATVYVDISVQKSLSWSVGHSRLFDYGARSVFSLDDDSGDSSALFATKIVVITGTPLLECANAIKNILRKATLCSDCIIYVSHPAGKDDITVTDFTDEAIECLALHNVLAHDNKQWKGVRVVMTDVFYGILSSGVFLLPEYTSSLGWSRGHDTPPVQAAQAHFAEHITALIMQSHSNLKSIECWSLGHHASKVCNMIFDMDLKRGTKMAEKVSLLVVDRFADLSITSSDNVVDRIFSTFSSSHLQEDVEVRNIF